MNLEIGETELASLIRMLGVNMNPNELFQTMLELDQDGSGEVDFAEFFEWWRNPATEGRFAVCKERMASVKDVFDEMVSTHTTQRLIDPCVCTYF